MGATEYAEMIAAVSIGVLSAVFISAFLILILICRRHKMYKKSLWQHLEDFSRSDLTLITTDKSELELGEVPFNTCLEEILSDEQWIGDATGLVPHCLAILKTCRSLTEKLTALTLGVINNGGSGLDRIIESARRISSRVDDMVSSMYPPLDPRLLEARAAALTLAVVHLALIAKYECQSKSKSIGWIDKALLELEVHMKVLREAALNQEPTNKIHTIIS